MATATRKKRERPNEKGKRVTVKARKEKKKTTTVKSIRYHGISILVHAGPKRVIFWVGETPHRTLDGAKADIDGKPGAANDIGYGKVTKS